MFQLFASGIATLFFVSSLILLNYGRQLGLRYMEKKGVGSMSGLPTIEGAVFGLVGLLLAFTITGALQRFDNRRQLIVQEANAITTAYDRLALFQGDARDLQAGLKDYTKARIRALSNTREFLMVVGSSEAPEQRLKIHELKDKLWDATVAACPQANYPPACSLALIALSSVFEVARLREGAAEKHPPQIVYIMLFGLGLGGSLLAGFAMAPAGARSEIHMVIFAATLAITLYVVTDMEFPRLGLIRLGGFDHFLVDVYEQMR